MEEEKKCPFCGNKLELETEFLGEKVYRCSNCGATICFGSAKERTRKDET